MKEEKSSQVSGLGVSTTVFIVFLILKLTNIISWSWWWITSPLWISALLFVTLTMIFTAILMTKDWKRRRKH